jgi:replicative DNA helicase
MQTNYVSQEMETKAVSLVLKLPFNKTKMFITRNSFFWGSYRTLYDVVKNLYDKEILANREVVLDELKRLNILETIFIYEETEIIGEEAVDYLYDLKIEEAENESIFKLVYDYATKREIKKLLDKSQQELDKGVSSAEELVKKIDKSLAKIAYLSKTRVHSPIYSLGDVAQQADKIMIDSANGNEYYMKTGITALDNKIRGVFKSQLISIAGAQGQGKSALLKTLAENIALYSEKPKKVGIITLEMPNTHYYFRTLARITGIKLDKLITSELTESEWKSVKSAREFIESKKDMMFYDDCPASLSSIEGKMLKMMDEGVEVFCVDQLSLVQGNSENIPQYLWLDKVSYGLKTFALDYNVVIMVAQQMNRGGTKQYGDEQRDPILQDLAQAGENAPNLVLMFKHWYNKDVKGMIEKSSLYIVKNRDGENQIEIPVYFEGKRFWFRDLTESEKTILDTMPDFVTD